MENFKYSWAAGFCFGWDIEGGNEGFGFRREPQKVGRRGNKNQKGGEEEV